MQQGIVFDIKEFTVFDGPGIRTTVFFKGCPLRCTWCHNPEGLSFWPELMASRASCTHCGHCKKICPSPLSCIRCWKCIPICPLGLRRVAGIRYEAEELAGKLLRNAEYLARNEGGFTISGGEPTAQGEFLLELLGHLRGNHRAVETNGFCSADIFAAMLRETDLVLLDIKFADSSEHRRWTGQDNVPILENMEILKATDTPYIIRIPVIPSVNDSAENFRAIGKLLEVGTKPLKIELLPYHKTAGAKYSMLGMKYCPGFDVSIEPRLETNLFLEQGIPCSII
jgi:pyruvate formate lyase activating enzyme